MIVTGGSSGIGRAVASQARADGWDVLAPPRAELELRDGASIYAFAERAKQWSGGRLDALINNAGVALAGAVEELRIDDIREQFEVNVFGHVSSRSDSFPHCAKRGGTSSSSVRTASVRPRRFMRPMSHRSAR